MRQTRAGGRTSLLGHSKPAHFPAKQIQKPSSPRVITVLISQGAGEIKPDLYNTLTQGLQLSELR